MGIRETKKGYSFTVGNVGVSVFPETFRRYTRLIVGGMGYGYKSDEYDECWAVVVRFSVPLINGDFYETHRWLEENIISKLRQYGIELWYSDDWAKLVGWSVRIRRPSTMENYMKGNRCYYAYIADYGCEGAPDLKSRARELAEKIYEILSTLIVREKQARVEEEPLAPPEKKPRPLTSAEKSGLMSGAVMVINRVADDLADRIRRILLARGARPRVEKEVDKSGYPDEYVLRIHSPIADITLRARIVEEREGGAVEYSMEGVMGEGEYGCRETISFSTTDRKEFEERAEGELVGAWEKVQECVAVKGSATREISKEFEELGREGEKIHRVALRTLRAARTYAEATERELEGEVSVEELRRAEGEIVRLLDEVHDASNKLVAFKEWVEKTAEELKRKYPAEAEFIEDLKNATLRKHNVEGLLSALGEQAGNLARLLDEVRIEIEMKMKTPEGLSEKLKVEEKPPAPPKPPEKKPPERPFSELARKLAIEKLTYFTKAKALELGFSVGEANRIVRDLKDELTLLGTAIVTGDTTQEAAEREIEEGLRNLKRKKEEQERRKEEEKERKAPRMSRREALTRIKRDVEIALRDQGYRGVTKALDYIGPELEALAEDVAEGQLSVEEAVKRAINLAKQYATPPKPGAPPAASGVEVRPEGFLSASEVADIIWRDYLGDLFNFGVRYVFENYMRERGMLEQDLGRVVGRLASKLRHLGSEMRKRGEETGVGRYIWVGKALTKYAPEIVQFGLLWAMRKIVPEIWPELRLFGNVVEALRETGIEGSIAKALTGVVYDYLAIPPDKWPEDIRRCYEVFVEASREASQPRKGGERDLWRLYG